MTKLCLRNIDYRKRFAFAQAQQRRRQSFRKRMEYQSLYPSGRVAQPFA
jgi:hypothetical protein